jgi:hypothetical protein
VQGEPVQRTLNERCDCCRLLIVVQLDVGEPRVVIDDRVSEVIADPRARLHPLAAAL